MFNEEHLQDAFVFEYRSADGTRNMRHEVSFEDFTTWNDVHKSFIDFLGAVYGYDIHKKVSTDE